MDLRAVLTRLGPRQGVGFGLGDEARRKLAGRRARRAVHTDGPSGCLIMFQGEHTTLSLPTLSHPRKARSIDQKFLEDE